MSFSSGDFIALAIGAIALLRWMVDAFFKKAGTDEEKLAALRLDFEKDKAAAEEIRKTIFASLQRQERGLNNIQAQFRMLISGGSNKRLEIRDMEDDS